MQICSQDKSGCKLKLKPSIFTSKIVIIAACGTNMLYLNTKFKFCGVCSWNMWMNKVQIQSMLCPLLCELQTLCLITITT